MLSLFFRFELEKVTRYFKTKTTAKVITSLLFLFVFSIVGLGIYGFFVSGLRYVSIESGPDIEQAITLFLYEVFFLMLAGVIVISALLSSLFTLFRGENNNWLIASPSYKLFPKVVFFRSVLASSLPSLIMFVPTVFAFEKIYNVGLLAQSTMILSMFLLLLLLCAITLCLIVIVGSFYYTLSQKFKKIVFSFKGLLLSISVPIILIMISAWKAISTIDLAELFKAENTDATLSATTIGSHFILLPTHPFALQIVSFQSGEVLSAFNYFFVLLALTVLAVILWWIISPRYYPLWQRFQEGITPVIDSENTKEIKNGYTFSGGQLSVLLKKELLVTSRNFKGVLWFLFLFSIWLLQIGISTLLDNNVQRQAVDVSTKVAVLQALQFVISVYFIASFSLRFAFPSFSTEKKTAWILGSAPLSFKRIFLGKYAFFALFFVAIGVVMSYVNTLALKLTLENGLLTSVLLASMTALIVAFALSLGALFPNTESDDPEAATTSIGGLFFTGVSLSYGSFGGYVLYQSTLSNSTSNTVILTITTLLITLLLVLSTPALVKRRHNNN